MNRIAVQKRHPLAVAAGPLPPGGRVPYVAENKRPKRKPNPIEEVLFCNKAENEMREIELLASSVVEVTATGLPCLANARITDVLVMHPPVPPTPQVSYKGYLHLTYVNVETDMSGSGWSSVSDAANLDRILRGRNMLPRSDIGIRRGKVNGILHERQARILIKPGNTKAQHQDAVRYCLEQPEPITVIEHNDNTIKLHRPHNHPLFASDPVVAYAASDRNGESAYTIAGVTQMVKDENRADPRLHNHLVYVAGLKAERCASFVSSDFEWGLTHMYICIPKSAGAHTLVHTGGRLTGMYAGDPRLVLFGSEETLTDYFLCNEVMTKITSALREAAPTGPTIVSENGAAFGKKAEEISLLLDSMMPDRRWAAPNRSKRLNLNQIWTQAVRMQGKDAKSIVDGMHHAIRLYPDHTVLDHQIALEGVLSDRHRRIVHDAIHQRGPAPVGSPVGDHLRALRKTAYVGPNGRTDLLSDLMDAIKAAVRTEMAEMCRLHGQKFTLPDWVSFDPLDKVLPLKFEAVSLVNASRGKSSDYRYRATNRITKGRNEGSNSGRIDYFAHSSYLVCPNLDKSMRQSVSCIEEITWSDRQPLGIIVRLVAEKDVKIRKVVEGGKVRFTGIAGPVLYWTAERQVTVRHESDVARNTQPRVLFTMVGSPAGTIDRTICKGPIRYGRPPRIASDSQ